MHSSKNRKPFGFLFKHYIEKWIYFLKISLLENLFYTFSKQAAIINSKKIKRHK